MDLYEDASLYDIVHGGFANPETFQFYFGQIQRCGPPVLELACGTGHVLIPLAEAGADILGLDISAEMLRECECKASERKVEVKAILGDMRRFDLERKFATIFIAGNSFQHLLTSEDVSACFASVKGHLKPGGRFIVEVFNPSLMLLAREPGKRFMVGECGEYVLSEDVKYDLATQINQINWHFWHRPTGGEKTLSFAMRQFFPEEFNLLFEHHGFRVEDKFGDLDGSEFRSESRKQIVVAKLQ